MPKKEEDALREKAKELHLSPERANAFVYDIMRKHGWIQSNQKDKKK